MGAQLERSDGHRGRAGPGRRGSARRGEEEARRLTAGPAADGLYVERGGLSYEYNLFEIARTHIRAETKLTAGRQTIEVVTRHAEKKAAGPLDVTLKVNAKEVAKGLVLVSAPLGFTANDCLDIGTDLGSPVSIDYFDRAPFEYNGTIDPVRVKYVE